MAIFMYVLLLCMLNIPAYAAKLSITPTSIVLHPQQRTAALNFTNLANKPVTLQIFFKSWKQSEGGKMQLRNSREVIVFPRILKIAPGRERPIRIGFRGRWPRVERGFRIFADELPDINIKSGTGVIFPVRLSIPLFVRNQAAAVPVNISIIRAFLENGQIRLTIRNNATQHVAINKIQAQIYDQRGRLLKQQTDAGGRVLAKSQVFFDLAVPTNVCRQVRSVKIELTAQRSKLQKRFNLNPRGCSKRSG